MWIVTDWRIWCGLVLLDKECKSCRPIIGPSTLNQIQKNPEARCLFRHVGPLRMSRTSRNASAAAGTNLFTNLLASQKELIVRFDGGSGPDPLGARRNLSCCLSASLVEKLQTDGKQFDDFSSPEVETGQSLTFITAETIGSTTSYICLLSVNVNNLRTTWALYCHLPATWGTFFTLQPEDQFCIKTFITFKQLGSSWNFLFTDMLLFWSNSRKWKY